MRTRIAALALSLTAACSYSFDNPAEQLGTGQALGRVVVDRAASGSADPLAGALVALENSPGFDQLTRATGRFTLLSLPVGRHLVLFRKGTEWAAQRVVEIAPGLDGKPEGVNLGDVRLRYTVTLSGTLSLPAIAPFLTRTFRTVEVRDEITGQPATLASGASASELRYTLQGLSVGSHRLRFFVASELRDASSQLVATESLEGGPVSLDVPTTSEGQSISLVPVSLRALAAGSGTVRFRVQIVAPVSVSPSGAAVELHDPALFDPIFPTSISLLDTAVPDSAGYVHLDEPAGLYVARVIPPFVEHGGGEPIFLEAPAPLLVLVRGGRLDELGTVYLLDSATGSAAANTCFADADCADRGTGAACSGGQCVGGTPTVPPDTAPFTTPFCIPVDAGQCQSTPGQPCAVGEPISGTCQLDCLGDPGAQVCVPAGAAGCTTDGTLLTGNQAVCPN